MKKKSLTWALLGCLVICAAFLLLHFSAGASKSSACPESMESCCNKNDGGSKMIWENLSHQFFSSF